MRQYLRHIIAGWFHNDRSNPSLSTLNLPVIVLSQEKFNVLTGLNHTKNILSGTVKYVRVAQGKENQSVFSHTCPY